MKIIGKKSVSSAISIILLIIFVILSIFLIFSMAILVLVSTDVISFSVDSLKFQLQFGALAFSMPNDIEVGAPLIFIIFCFGLILLYIVHQLRKIFRNFSLEQVFEMENVNSLRKIGIFIVAMAFVHSSYTYSCASIVHDLLVEKGVNVVIKFGSNTTMIFSGILILVFAEIFRIAVRIAKENELTI